MNNVEKFLVGLKQGKMGIITSQELEEKIKNNQQVYILDIRRKEDYEKSFIENSQQCEWLEIGDLIKSGNLPKDRDIIVACYTGQSSMQVATLLNMEGYSAYSLVDGIVNWIEEGREVHGL
jgi:rhodanese-related sulfurtransferase